MEQENLECLEARLNELLDVDKKNWVSVYKIMAKIEENNLWKSKHKSYRGWLVNYAKNNQVHESYLWHIRQAGNFYARFEQRCQSLSQDHVALNKINIPVDSVRLVAQISEGNPEQENYLIKKLIAKELTRNDLRNAWAAVKAQKEHQTNKKTEDDHKNNSSEKIKTNTSIEKEKSDRLKTANITQAVSKAYWLPDEIYDNDHRSQFVVPKYKISTELPVRLGTTRNARRIDVFVAENYTVNKHDKAYSLNLHAIEIKVSPSDLKKDHKMSEYHYFADYCWLAVPYDMRAIAEELLNPGWGLIVVDDDNQAKVHKLPSKQDAALVHKYTALTTFFLRQ